MPHRHPVPLDPAHAGPGAPPADEPEATRPDVGPRIAVLDDDPVNVLLLSRLLAGAGYTHVDTYTDPVVATRELLADPPDLLMLDIRMPVLDGYAVLAELAPLLHAPHDLAVIVLTADLTAGTRQRALVAGARDFLTKPFDLVELSLRVANLLETKDLHRRLREQNERLERAIAERTETLVRLAGDLAHEVRTPLYAIRGIAEVLLDFEDGLPDALRNDIGQIDEIAVLALELVDAEIDAARLAAQQTVPAMAEVDVGQVLADLRSVMERTTWAPGLELEVADGRDLPPIVTDATRVGQVLRNLVANALATGAQGVVRVDAELVDDGERIAFHVRDPGAGVPAHDRERIFVRFERGEGRGVAGGIGLPIARRIARLLGGDVTVQGPPEHDGSCFTATVSTRLDHLRVGAPG
jgi:signal transduction histidine kinase